MESLDRSRDAAMTSSFDEKCPLCGEECDIIDRRPDDCDEYDLEDGDVILYYACSASGCGWTGHVSDFTGELLSEDEYGG